MKLGLAEPTEEPLHNLSACKKTAAKFSSNAFFPSVYDWVRGKMDVIDKKPGWLKFYSIFEIAKQLTACSIPESIILCLYSSFLHLFLNVHLIQIR